MKQGGAVGAQPRAPSRGYSGTPGLPERSHGAFAAALWLGHKETFGDYWLLGLHGECHPVIQRSKANEHLLTLRRQPTATGAQHCVALFAEKIRPLSTKITKKQLCLL